METRMEIQGRRRVRHPGGDVRDEVRHASSTTEAEAREIAHRIAAEGFTVWIFQVERGPGIARRYRGIATLPPDRASRQAQPGVSAARCAA
jgi:hypothetical protein